MRGARMHSGRPCVHSPPPRDLLLRCKRIQRVESACLAVRTRAQSEGPQWFCWHEGLTTRRRPRHVIERRDRSRKLRNVERDHARVERVVLCSCRPADEPHLSGVGRTADDILETLHCSAPACALVTSDVEPLVQQRLHGLVYDAPNSLTNDDKGSRQTRAHTGRSTQTPQT